MLQGLEEGQEGRANRVDIVNESSDIMNIAQRIGPIVGGLFFFCFGLPFTLVPFMMFIDGEFDLGDPGFTVFMIAFSLPFLFAGLTLNFMGLGMIRWALVASTDPALAPRLGKIGPERIAITEHPFPEYRGEYVRQSEIVNGRDWYRMVDSNHRLYYYAANEGGRPGWSIDDRQDTGARDWFNGGWFSTTGSTIPSGRQKWNDLDPSSWVEIEVLESAEKKSNWWERKS